MGEILSNHVNNASVEIDASAARTATGPGVTMANPGAQGAMFLIAVTAVSGTTPTLTARVQYSVNGSLFSDLDSTNAITSSITATGNYTIKVSPGASNTAAFVSNLRLPRTYRLLYTIGGTTPSFTFSSHAAYLP